MQEHGRVVVAEVFSKFAVEVAFRPAMMSLDRADGRVVMLIYLPCSIVCATPT